MISAWSDSSALWKMVQVDFMAQEKPGKKSYILSSTANYNENGIWSFICSLGGLVSVNYLVHMQRKGPDMYAEHTLSFSFGFPTRFGYQKCKLEMG